MTTEVTISNMALSHIGDAAVVTSIDPPDNSTQAQRCAQFYPEARDALLEMHDWNFATKRTYPAMLSSPVDATVVGGGGAVVTTTTFMPGTQVPTPWKYVYQAPTDMIRARAILDPTITNENSTQVPMAMNWPQSIGSMQGLYTPQEFEIETDDEGRVLILTNQQNAVLRYTALVTDPNKFSPLFTATLSYVLASYLAGAIIKGQEGIAVAQQMMATATGMLGEAESSDTNQRRLQVVQSVPWMVNR